MLLATVLINYSGGIRGILELSILKRVVAEVGYGIPVQELFDLVIGTSAG